MTELFNSSKNLSPALKSCSVTVVLTDDAEREISFEVGFDDTGKYFEGDSEHEGDELGSHTINAYFGRRDGRGGCFSIDIDGNGWRDIEGGDHLADFIGDVILAEGDADEFLMRIKG